MQRPSLTLNTFKRFAAAAILLSPAMLVVGCGADPVEGDSTDSAATESETPKAPAADGSGSKEDAAATGSGSK